jgi:hypothetical protein
MALVDIGKDTPWGSKSLGETFPSLSTLITLLLRNSLVIAGIVLLALLIFGGFTFIMAAGSGDAKKAEQSKGILTNVLIGFAIVFTAYFIIQIIEVLTGLPILNPNL